MPEPTPYTPSMGMILQGYVNQCVSEGKRLGSPNTREDYVAQAIRALATHDAEVRAEGAAQERGAVVAWLDSQREKAREGDVLVAEGLYIHAAKVITAAEHIKEEK